MSAGHPSIEPSASVFFVGHRPLPFVFSPLSWQRTRHVTGSSARRNHRGVQPEPLRKRLPLLRHAVREGEHLQGGDQAVPRGRQDLEDLLTNRSPFPDSEIAEARAKTLRGDSPSVRSIQHDVPRALEAICLKAMALKAEDRYGARRELADDIEHWVADERVETYGEPFSARSGRWIRKELNGLKPVTVRFQSEVNHSR